MPATATLTGVHEYEKRPDRCPDETCDDPTCTHRGEEPLRTSSWMDPQSPIVHWSIPRRDDEFVDDDGEPVVVTLPLVPAARLIAEWPGTVSGHREGEFTTIDWQYGVQHNCTLFVDAPDCIWQLVAAIERIHDRQRRGAWSNRVYLAEEPTP